MNYASRGLSKELQELSGWVDGGRENGVERYTLAFLLEKLPAYMYDSSDNLAGWITLTRNSHGDWCIGYSSDNAAHVENTYVASNPADAVAKLCITMFKLDQFKKEA